MTMDPKDVFAQRYNAYNKRELMAQFIDRDGLFIALDEHVTEAEVARYTVVMHAEVENKRYAAIAVESIEGGSSDFVGEVIILESYSVPGKHRVIVMGSDYSFDMSTHFMNLGTHLSTSFSSIG